jgi:hypothetical protein
MERTMWWSAVSLLIVSWTPGCSGGDSGPSGAAAGEFITCDANTVKVTGTLGGEKVDIAQPAAGGGFSQFNGGQYCTQCNSLGKDPALIDVALRWMGLVANGSTADATGEIVMPSAGPLAGQKLCAGAGTRIRMANDGEMATLQFVVRGIQGGAACADAVSGELHGCYYSPH